MTNVYNGVPHDHQASGLFPSDPTNSYFFYYDGTINKVYKHNSTSNTTSIHDIGSGTNQLFPGLPTNQAMDRALFTQNVLYVKWKPPTGSYIQIRYTNSTTASGGQTSTPSDVDQQAATANNSYSVLINSVNTFAVQLPQSGFAIDHAYTTGLWGGTTTPYTGLPQTGHRSMAMITGFNSMVNVFYDTGIVYTIDLSSQTVVSSAPYGASAPPASNNVFNGVPHNHQASGTFPNDPTITYFFYYDGTINKVYKHNSTSNTTSIHDIGSGVNQLFPNLPTNQAMDRAVYSSNGSMYIKWENPSGVYQQLRFTDAATYSGSTTLTPTDDNIHDARTANSSYAIAISPIQMIVRLPLNGWATDHQYNQGSWGGTTTPYTGLPQTGHRSINMITGFNSMVNVFYDTGIVYTIDLSSQTVVSSAPYGASAPPTAVDDKYWDLENDAVAKLNGVILPAFEIFQFTPNIIAGNYPQSGTAKEPLTGCAYYLNGTWTEWTQTSANVWAPSGNTLTFTSSSVNPGIDTNGAAYIGTTGGFSFSPNWASSPFTWIITPSNQVKITLNNGTPITFSPLADLPQPQNTFTAAQFESGLFSSSDVGTLTTSVLISNSVSSFKSPVFPREIDLTFLSESQVIIRRSWEIVDTTYTITSSNVLSGQYVSPTYPAQNNGTTLPDSYHMPTEWVVLANNDSQFFIEFSGGLNNTITSDGAYNMAVNPVGPSSVTYTWTANYYTSADVLISPVIGFGATGSVSNFNITLTSVPASAEYILYVCTSSENVQAFASLVIIQSAAAIPFVLDFQNQSAQIVTDATYSVTPNPVDAGTTYAYTATYNNEFDASLGNVLGAVASGSSSSFNFVYANIPTGTKYINYTCSATGGNQGGETARLSISIIPQIPPTPQSFELQFNGGAYPVNITTNGNYSVVPFPTESALIITYTYTADYYAGVTKLGSVVGFDPTGQSSSFPFTFAGMPTGAQYIKYICTASGTGLQNGQSAESIIGLVPPSGSGSGDVDLIRSTSGSIIFNQYNSEDSLKLLTNDRLTGLTMTLTDSYGDTIYSPAPCYYELNVRSSNSG